jgi:hypothetical protein
LRKNKIGPAVALLVALFLLFGIALTQSRTAIGASVILVGMALLWRKLWPSPRHVVAAAAGLAIYLLVCLLAIEPISSALLLEKPFSAVERIGGSDIRWEAYKMFVDAALQKPWLGYGVSTVAPAHLAVAEHHANFPAVFQQSHNLFLDLVLWLGIPLGGAVSIGLAVWFFRRVSRVACAEDALLVMFVSVVALHAMLEMPLHYAYMLLPTGLVMGTLNARLGGPVIAYTRPRIILAMWLAAAVLLAAITRDYLLIEADFEALRFEKAYRIEAPAEPPGVLVLTHLSEFVRLGRGAATVGMSSQEIDRLRDVADAFPSPSNLYLHTAALALNGRGEEAQLRMKKISKVMPAGSYQEMGRLWTAQTKGNKSLPKVVEWLEVAGASAPSQGKRK